MGTHIAVPYEPYYTVTVRSPSFAKGYITCHMLTFIRQVGRIFLLTLVPSDGLYLLTERYTSAL